MPVRAPAQTTVVPDTFGYEGDGNQRSMADELAKKRLAEARRLTEQQLEEVRDDTMTLLRDVSGEVGDYDQHGADSASELEVRERDERRAHALEERLAAIDRAERRIAEGRYGMSIDSGQPIPVKRLASVPWAERTVEEEEAFRFPVGDGADEEGNFSTPLDEPAPPPTDLAAIPLTHRAADREYDPQEEDGDVAIDGPGLAYADEGGPPSVGEPERDDAAVERAYRPD
jgi:DnaK suppressor protein